MCVCVYLYTCIFIYLYLLSFPLSSRLQERVHSNFSFTMLGTKLITLCEMNQKLNQSVSLRAVGWLLRQHGGVIPPHSLPPSFTFNFFSLSLLFSCCILSFQSPYLSSFFLTSCFPSLPLSPRPARAPPPCKQRHNQILPPPACSPGSRRQNDSFYYSS